jgi:hypothetical protein
MYTSVCLYYHTRSVWKHNTKSQTNFAMFINLNVKVKIIYLKIRKRKALMSAKNACFCFQVRGALTSRRSGCHWTIATVAADSADTEEAGHRLYLTDKCDRQEKKDSTSIYLSDIFIYAIPKRMSRRIQGFFVTWTQAVWNGLSDRCSNVFIF